MEVRIVTIISAILCICDFSSAANILAVIPSPFYSHQATYRPIWRELAKKGHQITLITTDLMEENKNITQIDYSGTYALFEKLGVKDFLVNKFNPFSLFKKLQDATELFMTYQLTHPGLVELIEKNKTFDLMFIEMLLPKFAALSYTFKAPYIGLTTMDAASSLHESLGNAMHPALYPSGELGFVHPLTFRERLISTVFTVGLKLYKHFILSPLGEKYVKKYLGEDCPDSSVYERNASLVFVNANPIFFPPRPSTPVTINLGGGLHLKKSEKLPEQLQSFLDESSEGCIYFSFGSTVDSNVLKPDTIEMFRKTFEELHPVKVLWKYENETLRNKPKNLEIKKWLPQQDILRHPNVKLFITQGGLQSMEEAIEYSVPTLGIPFFGDQMYNVKRMVSKKIGLSLDIKTLNQVTLKNTIMELLNNPQYKVNIDKLSKIQKDRPMSALETAIWWTEYILRNGGAEHLRSPSADISFYEYFFLDIFVFALSAIVVFKMMVSCLIKSMRYIIRMLLKLNIRKQKMN